MGTKINTNMRNTILTRKSILILTFLLSLGFTSCKKGWWGYEEEGKGGSKGGGGTNLEVMGTVYAQPCGVSIYNQNYWIQLDNGTTIQPCYQSFQTLCPIELKQGDRVQVKYHPFKGIYPDFETNCNIPYFPFTKATIDAIQVIANQTEGCKPIILTNNIDQYEKAWIQILEANFEGSKLKLKVGFSGCSSDIDRFKLYLQLGQTVNNKLSIKAKIIEENPQLCQAYFTKTLCFDLANMQTNANQIQLLLEGFEKEIVK